MTFPNGETVTRIRPPVIDVGTGDPVPGSGAEVDIAGVVVWPRGDSSELNDGRTTVIIGLWMLAPAGTDIEPTDKFRVRGDVYDVEGEAAEWGPSPLTGTSAGVQAALTRVRG